MIIQHPIWLLLLIPVAAGLYLWPMPSRLLTGMRILILLLLALALCAPAIRIPSHVGTVIVVADGSLSMPSDNQTRQMEVIDLLQKSMPRTDRLGIVTFGEKIAVEKFPLEDTFSGFVHEVETDGSRLSEALERALSLIPPKRPGRILVLSDGRATGGDPGAIAAQAAGRNIAIDYRLQERPALNDTAISRVDAPVAVYPGQSFLLTAWIYSPAPQEIQYELVRGKTKLAAGIRSVSSGLTRFTFRDQGEKSGTQSYLLRIRGGEQDPVPENNTAKILVGVEGSRAVRCVTQPPESSGLVSLLQRGELDIQATDPDSCLWSLEELSNYSAVILEDAPANKIGTRGMENLAAWVEQAGGGLMMTGGKNAYGPGGYYKSPLEHILPVSMELRREHREFQLAIVIALDRSGSMSMQVGKQTKMDLANLASVEVLELLTETDELGVIAVDSSAHVIADCQKIGDNPGLRERILSIESRGGGIFVYTALTRAFEMIQSAEAGTRHIILFADAADAEEPGQYRELLAKCNQANITVSVIGLGKPTDKDARFLEDVAARGAGRIYFTEDAEDLPRLFAQDTFVVARQTFINEQTAFKITGSMVGLTQFPFSPPGEIGGYNLCYLREGVSPAAVTMDKYEAPIVAAWLKGLGRVLCYTGQADGQYTGPLVQWQDVGHFFTSQARWTAGAMGEFENKVLITQKVENGVCRIQAHLDPDRTQLPFDALPRVTTLRSASGTRPRDEHTVMQWEDADTLAVQLPLRGSETILSTVEIDRLGRQRLVPVCLAYSPEYRPSRADYGQDILSRLARATGGKDRIELNKIWDELPKQVQRIEMAHYLILAAVGLFLLEILERRTGILAFIPQNVTRRRQKIKKKKMRAEESAETERTDPEKPTASPPPTKKRYRLPHKAKTEKTAPSEADSEMLDAFRQARHRARDRRGE
jgi:Mg-chelatase subunit ChlD